MLVLIDNPGLGLVCESSTLGNRKETIFVCPSSQANNAFVSSSVVVSFKNVRLRSPNAEWWERKEKLKEGRVREIKLDMRSNARVNDAVNRASFCSTSWPIPRSFWLRCGRKKAGHWRQMNDVTKSVKSLRNTRSVTSFSNRCGESVSISRVVYNEYEAAKEKSRETVAQRATVASGRWDRMRYMISFGRCDDLGRGAGGDGGGGSGLSSSDCAFVVGSAECTGVGATEPRLLTLPLNLRLNDCNRLGVLIARVLTYSPSINAGGSVGGRG